MSNKKPPTSKDKKLIEGHSKFLDEYLWDKNNFKGYKKPFRDGVGHKEMFQTIA